MFEQLIWVVPATVVAAGVLRPRWAIPILLASLPLFGSPPGGPYLAALDCAVVAAIVACLRLPRQGATSLRWPLVAMAVCGLASLVPLAYSPPSWTPSMLGEVLRALPGVETNHLLYTWRAALGLLLGLGLYVGARRSIEPPRVRSVGLTLATSLFAVELLGLLSWLGVVDLDGYRAVAYEGRLHSLFFNSGWLAEFVVIAAPIAIAALWMGGRSSRGLALGLLVLSLATLWLASQRGGWLAVLLQLTTCAVLWTWWHAPAPRLAVGLILAGGALAALLVVGLTVIVPHVQESVDGESPAGPMNPRIKLWGAALELARERPALGFGVGSFTPAFDSVYPPRTRGNPRHRGSAHNLYLHTAAEQGALGVTALLMLMVALYRLHRQLLDSPEPLTCGLALSLLGFFGYGFFQHSFFLPIIAFLFWILAGTATKHLSSRPSPSLDRLSRVLIAVALAALAYRAVESSPLSSASNRSLGFHETESAKGVLYRWTDSRAARRLTWSHETLVLSFANGHPLGGERPIEVALTLDGKPAGRIVVPGGWQEHRLELGPPSKQSIVLGIEARPAFRPFSSFRRYPQLEPSRDVRRLAVAVREPAWEGALNAPANAPEARRRQGSKPRSD